MAEVIQEVLSVKLWDEVAMVEATLSKLENPEDTRTITRPVSQFLGLDLADTEDNSRKIKHIKKEVAKLHSALYDSVQPIKWHGASMWRFVSRYLTTCVPKQRKSESRSNASIASTTNLCSPAFNSSSPGNEPEQEKWNKHEIVSNQTRTFSAQTSEQCDAHEETIESYVKTVCPGWQRTGTLPQPGVGQDEEAGRLVLLHILDLIPVGRSVSVIAWVRQVEWRVSRQQDYFTGIWHEYRYTVMMEWRKTISLNECTMLYIASRSPVVQQSPRKYEGSARALLRLANVLLWSHRLPSCSMPDQ
ncbi:hypothetical protein IQ07DRAFT_639742 [Pyrenochaeta sp. DS3sAY3a]|nr:hypothetical protein IQ07DRAFT_639742 [Pyrenochaeta sp. DS3sAY3a]